LLDEQIVHVKQLANARYQSIVDVPPLLAGPDEPTVTQAGQVPAGVARAEVRGHCGFARGHLAIPQRFQERESGWVGETIEETSADTEGHAALHLRHKENDTPPLRQRRRVVGAGGISETLSRMDKVSVLLVPRDSGNTPSRTVVIEGAVVEDLFRRSDGGGTISVRVTSADLFRSAPNLGASTDIFIVK
jgi:hypothetical protein